MIPAAHRKTRFRIPRYRADQEQTMCPLRVRFTVRCWMVLVAIVAMLVASYLQITNSYLRNRYIAASKEHSTYARFYQEGRVTALKYLEKSQGLMEAQIALCSDDQDRAVCVRANLGRATKLMEQLLNEPLTVCGKGVLAEIAEAQEYIDAFRIRHGMEAGAGPKSEELEVSPAVLP